MLLECLVSLPATLEDTYARILKEIEKIYTKDAIKLLQWLACANQPLRVEELVDAIAVDIGLNLKRRYKQP